MNIAQTTTKNQNERSNFYGQRAQPTERAGYCWLALGTLFSLLTASGGENIPLAAWLAPLFFLRFMRTRRLRSGFVGIWLASVATTVFWLYRSNFYDPGLFSVVH